MHSDAPIRPEQWSTFLHTFSRRHRGWLVTLTVLPTEQVSREGPEPRREARRIAQNLPLEEIIVEPGGAAGASVTFLVGGMDGHVTHVAHEAHEARRMVLEQTPAGEHEGLRVDQTDGQTTLLHFRAAVAPEQVDGVAPRES